MFGNNTYKAAIILLEQVVTLLTTRANSPWAICSIAPITKLQILEHILLKIESIHNFLAAKF
jgi:hypothetical protein